VDDAAYRPQGNPIVGEPPRLAEYFGADSKPSVRRPRHFGRRGGRRAVEQLIRTRFDGRGTMLVRIGRAPKRLIPFCTDVPFAKRTLCYVAPNGVPQKVEFLGRGQQAVLYGTHKSGKPYHWHADRDPLKVPPKEWVKITEAEVDCSILMDPGKHPYPLEKDWSVIG
jgi:hypothetical protein